MKNEELKKPEEWQKESNFVVRDPDGWRNEDISWETPISRDEFERLAENSTIARRKM